MCSAWTFCKQSSLPFFASFSLKEVQQNSLEKERGKERSWNVLAWKKQRGTNASEIKNRLAAGLSRSSAPSKTPAPQRSLEPQVQETRSEPFWLRGAAARAHFLSFVVPFQRDFASHSPTGPRSRSSEVRFTCFLSVGSLFLESLVSFTNARTHS